MKKLLLLVLLSIIASSNSQAQWQKSLITVPELSQYEETSTYADVMSFLETVANESEEVHLKFMGSSPEGKKIPYVVISNDGIDDVESARTSGKSIIYIQGNIHAGEVEGKEILLILLREIAFGDKKHLLENQILLFAPIYNTDSNDKMSEENRRSQEGSPLKAGLRANSQGLDLNRDGIKMEAIETEALMTEILNTWDPHVFVDLHTTNGTWHGYDLTWAPSYHYAGEEGPYRFTWDELLPEVTDNVNEKYDLHLGPYGWYNLREGWPPKAIYTYNHHPRYLVNMMGLRNRIGILSEAFAHNRFYERMDATKAFVTEILEFTNDHLDEIIKITQQAEEEAVRKVEEEAGMIKGVRFNRAPMEETFSLRTYNYIPYFNDDGEVDFVRSGRIIEVPGVENYSRFVATETAKVPSGYIIPSAYSDIAEHLQMHGIEVKALEDAITLTGEEFVIDSLNHSQRLFEGHNMARAYGKYRALTVHAAAGDYLVDMAQPLTNLIFYMLEPQSDDGLVTWNFFDDYFSSISSGSEIVYPLKKFYED